MFVIEEELKKLPQKPGVYLMHDAQDNIIYVGKAIRLRSRVQSYFREKINRGPQIEKMVTQIARFEYCDGFGAGSPGSGKQSDQGTQSEIQHTAQG